MRCTLLIKFVSMDLQSQKERRKTGIQRGLDKWNGKQTER